MIKKAIRNISLLIVTLCMAAACSTSKHVSGGGDSGHLSSAAIYKQKVVRSALTTQSMTAKMSIDVTFGEKDMSLGGSLKMKRGEVIQLSLTFPIIGEVGRMEFTPTEVFIVDRINKRYVRASYSQVDFLRSANLDYYALESIFWNEIFYPGAKAADKLSDYTVASAGSHTLLSLSSTPRLDYAFLTITESALLNRITITPKSNSDNNALTCIYGNFTKFDNNQFPTSIKITFTGDNRSYGLDMSLSSLTTSSDWKSHTTLSSKYREMDAESLLKDFIP